MIILGFFITPGRVEAATHRVGVGGLDLATAIRSARVGDRVEIVAGVWSGPIIIDKAIDLVGAGGVIDGGGVGSVITIHASGTTLCGPCASPA